METNKVAFGPREAARALGISHTHVYRMIASGELPSARLGRRIVVPTDALKKWLKDRTTGGDSRG